MKSLVILFLFYGTLYCQSPTYNSINFKKADSIAHLYPAESIQNLPVLVYGLTSKLDSDAEKFRAIYTWVCTHIKNDYDSYKKTINKRKKLAKDEGKLKNWNSKYLPKVYRRLINNQKTSCTGYAFLIKRMATLADLKCEIVDGFARTANTELTKKSIPNHSWNAIRLNDKWRLCDPTWSAGKVTFDNDIPSFRFEYSEAYFLAPPELFSKNHYPIEKKWLLLSKPISLEEFLDGPLIYKAAFENQITPTWPTKMFLETKPGKTLNFEFITEQVTEDDSISLILVKGESSKQYYPTINQAKGGLSISHSFKRKGVYDVHLAINEKMIATYVVSVTKNSSYP